MRRLLPFALLLIAAVTAVMAQAPDTRVYLISEYATAKPGTSALIGVHFQIPAGWHMYWVNPGDAGEPPRVQWSLPAGWTAGDLQWPTPARLTNSAGVDYGYENDVTLLTSMKVGQSGGDVIANLRWLVCKDVCVPQKGSAKMTVRVGTSAADPVGKSAVDGAQEKLPKAIPAPWKANGFQNPSQVILNFRPGIKVRQANFFPEEREVVVNSAPQKLSSTSYAAQLSLKKSLTGKKVARLRGVLVVNGAEAYAVDVAVK